MCAINNVFMFHSGPPTNILKTPYFVDLEISKNFLCNFILTFSVIFLLKKKFVSTPDSEQSKTLLTIDEWDQNSLETVF